MTRRSAGPIVRRGAVRRGTTAALAAAVLVFAAALPASAAALRVVGSTTVNPVVTEAAETLTAERGLAIVVDTQGGSSGGIAALGDGRADVAMSSRPLGDDDFRKFPRTRFRPVTVGIDALAVVVSADVWQGGVRSISKSQARAIYEGRVTNWRQLGGPDRRIVFFNKEPGRGTWEVFAHWLYGDSHDAPPVAWPEVGSNEEGRTKVAGTRGAVTQLSAAWADGETVFALAVETEDGERVAPTVDNLAAGRYPLARPLLVITDGEPTGVAAALIELLLGARGQEIVRRHGYEPLPATAAAAVGKATDGSSGR